MARVSTVTIPQLPVQTGDLNADDLRISYANGQTVSTTNEQIRFDVFRNSVINPGRYTDFVVLEGGTLDAITNASLEWWNIIQTDPNRKPLLILNSGVYQETGGSSGTVQTFRAGVDVFAKTGVYVYTETQFINRIVNVYTSPYTFNIFGYGSYYIANTAGGRFFYLADPDGTLNFEGIESSSIRAVRDLSAVNINLNILAPKFERGRQYFDSGIQRSLNRFEATNIDFKFPFVEIGAFDNDFGTYQWTRCTFEVDESKDWKNDASLRTVRNPDGTTVKKLDGNDLVFGYDFFTEQVYLDTTTLTAQQIIDNVTNNTLCAAVYLKINSTLTDNVSIKFDLCDFITYTDKYLGVKIIQTVDGFPDIGQNIQFNNCRVIDKSGGTETSAIAAFETSTFTNKVPIEVAGLQSNAANFRGTASGGNTDLPIT